MSAVPTTNATVTPATASATASAHTQDVLPSPAALVHAAKLAIQQDKPIQLDYYVDTATGKAFLGEDKETKDKLLVKSAVEYTSHVEKVFKVGDDFLVATANSIYIVSGKIQKRLIESSSLHSEEDD
jgi:hypothetical protein